MVFVVVWNLVNVASRDTSLIPCHMLIKVKKCKKKKPLEDKFMQITLFLNTPLKCVYKFSS